MGIRFYCPNGHKLNVKEFQAGRKGICPYCAAKFQIPTESVRPSSRGRKRKRDTVAAAPAPPPEVNGVSSAPTPTVSGARAGAAEPAVAPPAVASPAAQPAPATVPPLDPAQPSMAPGPSFPAQPVATPAPTAAATPAADPLVEAPDMIWYVRPPSGGQFGPAQANVMRTWLAEGRVSADSLVWREGWRDWREAGELFPQLRAGTTTAGPASQSSGELPIPKGVHMAKPVHSAPPRALQSAIVIALIVVGLVLVVMLGLALFQSAH
jgi:hypothetical protein